LPNWTSAGAIRRLVQRADVLGVSVLLLSVVYLMASAFASDAGEGQIHAFSYATADDLVATTSPTFVKIPGMTVDINEGLEGNSRLTSFPKSDG